MLSLVLLATSLAAGSAQAATGFIDLSASGGVPDGSESIERSVLRIRLICIPAFVEASGILYGVPNNPAYAPNRAPAVPWDLFKGAGINYFRAGGAQIPAAGYSSGNIADYKQRIQSTKENYDGVLANGVKTFVLLPVSVRFSASADMI